MVNKAPSCTGYIKLKNNFGTRNISKDKEGYYVMIKWSKSPRRHNSVKISVPSNGNLLFFLSLFIYFERKVKEQEGEGQRERESQAGSAPSAWDLMWG